MVDAASLVESLTRRCIRLIPNPPILSVEPASKLTDLDRQAIRAHKSELLAHLCAQREEAEIDQLARADGWTPLPPANAPAYSIITTCQRHGVALRIDENGGLIVGKAGGRADEPGQPWPSLIMALEAHLDGVTALVKEGWTLRLGFRRKLPPKTSQSRQTHTPYGGGFVQSIQSGLPGRWPE